MNQRTREDATILAMARCGFVSSEWAKILQDFVSVLSGGSASSSYRQLKENLTLVSKIFQQTVNRWWRSTPRVLQTPLVVSIPQVEKTMKALSEGFMLPGGTATVNMRGTMVPVSAVYLPPPLP